MNCSRVQDVLKVWLDRKMVVEFRPVSYLQNGLVMVAKRAIVFIAQVAAQLREAEAKAENVGRPPAPGAAKVQPSVHAGGYGVAGSWREPES